MRMDAIMILFCRVFRVLAMQSKYESIQNGKRNSEFSRFEAK
jgi:hypothetical protein